MDVILFVTIEFFLVIEFWDRGSRKVDLKSESEWKLKLSNVELFFWLKYIRLYIYLCIYIYTRKVFRDAALIPSFRNKGVECHKALLSQTYRNGSKRSTC